MKQILIAATLTAAAILTSVSTASLAEETTPTDSATPPAHQKPWPPAVQMLSPSAPLNRKSQISVDLVHRWQGRGVKPTMGPRGEVRFIYGATEDTVVCAPLRLCDIALQAGEIVQNVNLGDPVMWSCPPAISGSGVSEITHLMCKPADAGLETSLSIQTSRRSYSINLVSTQKNYMPKVGWTYPEDQATQWAAYQLHGGGTSGHTTIPAAEGAIRYDITGDNPPWRPVVAYSVNGKTFIQFPPAMAYGKAPVLERLP
jgi:type IV secretion system protein VirB9